MFKTSNTVAPIAVNIDQEGPEKPLQSKEVYSTGSHLQCIGYKTLAFFVHQPAIKAFLELQQWN